MNSIEVQNSLDLYKVVEIKGKGMGCIALKDIQRHSALESKNKFGIIIALCERGTVILREKPQCVADVEKDGGNIKINVLSVIQSFEHMCKTDREEYLKLFNKYNDSRKDQKFHFTPSRAELKSDFVDLKSKLQLLDTAVDDDPNNKFLQKFVLEYGEQGFIEVIGIYYTNCFANGLGIKAARFNHSCCSNANLYVVDEEGPNEIRIVSNIPEGSEICLNYYGKMRNLKTRQKFLSSNFGFKCDCELCQKEIINNGNERYKNLEKCKQESQQLLKMSKQKILTYPKRLEIIRNEILCYKKMYTLSQIKKPSRFLRSPYHVLNDINSGFFAGVRGYNYARDKFDLDNMEYFKEECQKLSKIGFNLSEIISGIGSDSTLNKDWKERHCNFEQWISLIWNK